MTIQFRNGFIDLAINVFEKLHGDLVEFVVDWTDDGFHGFFNGVDAGFEWTRSFFFLLNHNSSSIDDDTKVMVLLMQRIMLKTRVRCVISTLNRDDEAMMQ
ncbi:unnamed protein product [Vicia faba]|uniref:Uncharacterized protein n=1 Tax=Vicia faba TaxID=3906 RepID=A0AAV1B9E8_VICFA|nr:unnamed protein product [Vicia faba]